MATTQPNILLILTDQQRGDALGLEGHPVLQTPIMDWFGANGTHFRRGYSECPSCIPARRTIMSGQAPGANGMVGMVSHPEWDPPATLAGELRGAGYETRMIGKLHLQPHRRRFGFDAMELADSTRGKTNDYLDWLHGEIPLDRWGMAHGATPNGWIGRPSHLPEEKSHTFWVVSRAIEYLSKRDPSAPFFLNVSFIDPHPPFTPPSFLFDRYDRQDLGDPHIGDWVETFPGPRRGVDPEGRDWGRGVDLDPHTMHYCRAGYFGLINHVDVQLSRLIQFMRDNQMLENTFILFASDHGEMLGDHHMFAKTRALEGSAHVPFLVRAGVQFGFPRQVVVDEPVGLQDVMPTLLDVAGVSTPASCTGRSVLPWVRGEKPAWREYLHGEHAGQYLYEYGVHYVVTSRMKYIWYSQTGQELLFDLAKDPNERHNLATTDDLAPWRRRMIEVLKDRPEGFVHNGSLAVGKPHYKFVPGKGPEIPWHDPAVVTPA